ncbi:MAG TPA: TetR/AcrR family transcriptional regulator [Allosphingosinicella sp.]|nr:TetR/AcrR family transcriptional regulator [Allosphingosinicella sp.]
METVKPDAPPEDRTNYTPSPYVLPTQASQRTFAAQTRGKGKRERTRARLIDATAELIANGGADNATIVEITATAGLASGTFYNHFKDRAEIIAETAINIMEQIAAKINLAGQAEDDIIVRLAAGTRRFLDIAYGHPTWAWAVLRSIDYLPGLRPRIYRYIGNTVHIGHESGHFSHEDDFTLYILSSMLFGAARARLSGKSGPETGSRVAEMQLRVLGVDAERAHAAAHCPIADVDFGWSDTAISNKGQPHE